MSMLKPASCICDYDVVSFDIFDTLVERALSVPQMVFHLAGERVLGSDKAKKFRIARVDAERRARALSPSAEVSLADIYDSLVGYDGSRNRLMEAELAVELECCKAKSSGLELFASAKRLGKRVVLVSDMYLSKDFLTSLLHNCGVDGFDNLYVSTEFGCSKRSGLLFERMLQCEAISADMVIHLGDDFVADVKGARMYGIDSVWLVDFRSFMSKLMQKLHLVF